ncbi:MAG: autotransporter outer membrane beta-barrel domain-containing protein [Devosia sp.]|nr:autotransporter outer membrane beta-barrel domain-containing protein [Devosia sp.]
MPSAGLRRWRLGLFASAAAGALVLAAGGPAAAACVDNGTSYDCTGDLSGGVTAGLPYDTLSIGSLTQNIAPASGTDGISFEVNGPLTLSVDTGDYGLSVTGADADGVVAQSYDGSKVGIDYAGDITSTGGYGIYTTGLGDISVTSSGAISAGLDAIHAESFEAGGGTVTIDHTGNLTSTGGDGVYATTQGDVSATTNGTIDSALDGIHLQSFNSGTVTIDETGDITSHGGYGIFASTQGDISATSSGNITSFSDGIHLDGYDAGNITLDHTGNITSSTGNGVWVDTQGMVNVTVTGDVTGATDGIYARTSGSPDKSVTVTHTGSLTAQNGSGIEALAPNGPVSVTNDGDITATADGIHAETRSADGVTVSQTGHITAARGIVAYSSSGTVGITGTGDIDATGIGVLATSAGGAVSVAQTGYVTSTQDEAIVLSSSTSSLTLTGSGAVTAHATAIDLGTVGEGAAITVNRTGAISSDSGYGILASTSQGQINITQTGDIQAYDDAVHATNTGYGEVAVSTTGAVTSTAGRGIYATSTSGVVRVTTDGLVSSDGDGIYAQSTGPGTPVVVNASGGVISTAGKGIVAQSSSGSIYLTDVGDVNAYGRGLEASSQGSQTPVSIWQTGDVTSQTAEGIVASAAQGAVNVNVWGNVQASSDAIVASNLGADYGVTVLSVGNVNSDHGAGIYAYAPSGSVSVSSTGNISAHGSSNGDIGDNAGIYAANIGSPETTVTVTANGDVSSDHGDAIYAGSTSSDVSVSTNGVITGAKNGIDVVGDGGALYVEIDGGTVTGGDGAGVKITGPGSSKLINYGTIANLNGIDAAAITATQTEAEIKNYGTITGNVSLSAWTNSFLNEADGLFNLGNSVDLGNLGNLLDNFGTVSVGGVDNVASTTLNGAFENEATGVIVEDLDLAGGTGDVLNVTGEANLSGTLKLNLTSFSATPQTIEILDASQWINTRDIAVTANPTIDAHVSYSDDNKTAYVTIDGFNFAPTGVTGNAADVGTYLNTAIVDNSSLAPIGVGLANLGTVDEVTAALNQLSPTIYNSDKDTTNVDNVGFVNRLFSCKVADGTDVFNAEGQCSWVRADYGTVNRTGSGDGSGFDARSFNISGGRQMALSHDLRLDVGAGAVSSNLATENGATSQGATGQLGAVLKYVPGPALLAASLTGSFGAFQNQRSLSFGGFSDTVKGDSQVATLDGRLRAAYTFQAGDYYFRPQLDLDAAYSHSGAIDETGTVASMHIDAADELALSVTPAFEIGGQTVLDDDSIFRPYLRGGVTVYADPSSTTSGSLVADTSSATFTVTSTSDRVLWNLSTGFDLLRSGGQNWRAFYDASFGATTTSQSGGVKLTVAY